MGHLLWFLLVLVLLALWLVAAMIVVAFVHWPAWLLAAAAGLALLWTFRRALRRGASLSRE